MRYVRVCGLTYWRSVGVVGSLVNERARGDKKLTNLRGNLAAGEAKSGSMIVCAECGGLANYLPVFDMFSFRSFGVTRAGGSC